MSICSPSKRPRKISSVLEQQMESLSLSATTGVTEPVTSSNTIVHPSSLSSESNTQRLLSISRSPRLPPSAHPPPLSPQVPQAQQTQQMQQSHPPCPPMPQTPPPKNEKLKSKVTGDQILDNPVTSQNPLKVLTITPEDLEAFRSMLQDFNSQFF